MKAIIFDLDGTLCELKPESEKHNHTGKEKVIRITKTFFISHPYNRIILTGRKEKYRAITDRWLKDHFGYYDELIMQSDPAVKNHIFKKEQLILLKNKYDIVLMIDDNPELVPVCEELSIPLFLFYKNEQPTQL